MDNNSNNKRLAKNTIFLYFRMLLILVIGLYTSRIVLRTLGISDYGLYNVVGGVVTMFSFLNGTLSTSTQRYLNFEIGKGEADKLKRVFSNALLIHCMLALFIFLLAETIGLWFVLHKLNIEPGRESAALWVYQFSIMAAIIQVIQLPFMSTIIAHEKMSIYAYVSIFEAFMKLLIVFLIQVASFDKLIFYAALYLVSNISVALMYNTYCRRHYPEARFSCKYEKSMFKEMLSYSGWNVIGSVAYICNSQGVNILFNLLFGTVINAARGVAFQVTNIISQFANNFQIAVKPQVVKYYAQGKIKEMSDLTYNAARYSAFLLLLIMAPVIAEIEFILKIWLGEYPDYAPDFIRVVCIQSVLNSMSSVVLMVVHASAKLKKVGIYAGVFNLLILPITYVLLKLGFSPTIALSANILYPLMETFIGLYWMNHYIGYSVIAFYKKVYGLVLPLGSIIVVMPLLIHYSLHMNNELVRFFVVCLSSLILSIFVIYCFGIGKDMRIKVKAKILSKIGIKK